jgi:cytochrome c peroxidase
MQVFRKALLISAVSTALSLPALAADLPWPALPDAAPVPKDNPMNDDKLELGKALFLDPRLSSTGTVSCNSCHNVMAGGDDNRPNSFGVHGQQGGRGAPTVWNAAFQSVQFWDGRAPTLEEQAKGPVTNPIEMGMADWDKAAERVKAIPGYAPMFKAAFGDKAEISVDTIAQAIAAYERTLITPNSAYDRYAKGEKDALSKQQVKGMNTFIETGCVACHSGVNFSGPEMPVGTGFYQKFPSFADNEFEKQYNFSADPGRFEATKKDEDKNMWRVPPLRNIALTAPYFHNGAVRTLEEAVKVMGKTQLNKDLSDEQAKDIVAFLEALTGEFPQQTMPRLPATPGTTLIEK